MLLFHEWNPHFSIYYYSIRYFMQVQDTGIKHLFTILSWTYKSRPINPFRVARKYNMYVRQT